MIISPVATHWDIWHTIMLITLTCLTSGSRPVPMTRAVATVTIDLITKVTLGTMTFFLTVYAKRSFLAFWKRVNIGQSGVLTTNNVYTFVFTLHLVQEKLESCFWSTGRWSNLQVKKGGWWSNSERKKYETGILIWRVANFMRTFC